MIGARALGSDRFEREAIRIALVEARRPERHAGVVDACLCHGTAGNAHLFLRLFHATKVTEFLGAFRFWHEKTLELANPGTGIGGYLSWGRRHPNLVGSNGWVSDASFLTGAAGVGLGLLSATTPGEPGWDRLLLCDIPAAEA